MAVDKEKNAQFLLTLPNDLMERVEEYWHENKIQNRNEAIRQLLIKGLQKEPLE